MEVQAAIILFVLIFFLTLIHEMGHFLMARFSNVPVAFFAIGFGPSVYSFKDKKGTRWRLNLIPLGGYVEMSDNGNETDAMLSMTPIKNILITLGGPFINIMFFIIGGVFFYNYTGLDVNVYKNNEVSYYVKPFNKESPPDSHFIIKKEASNINTYICNNEEINSIIGKKLCESETTIKIPLSIRNSFALCMFTTKSMTIRIVKMFTSIKELKKVKSIIMAQKQIKSMMNKSSNFKETLRNIMFYLLIMSLQLGIFNLLPIVGLDGFWILISIISLIFKPKLSNQRKLITIINYGTYLVFIIMGLILFRDIYDILKDLF
jgi:regulator of sigma E protease